MDIAYDNTSINEFKNTFKYYKQKACEPSFEDVIDFSRMKIPARQASCVHFKDAEHLLVQIDNSSMQQYEKWKVYTVNSVPGLYFITGVFSEENQIYWSTRCLESYSHAPHCTNLDAHQSKKESDEAWDVSKRILADLKKPGESHLLKQTPIWNLRWSTVGYHHNWNTKNYSKAEKSVFPEELAEACVYITSHLGFPDFTPEAAIVNFYHVGSTLAPHNDVSEADLRFPLISISLGLPAIFLIGNEDPHAKPVAIMLRSGDVLVMSGQSRLAYHAMPRVIPNTTRVVEACSPLDLYLQHSRININVRQVESADFRLCS